MRTKQYSIFLSIAIMLCSCKQHDAHKQSGPAKGRVNKYAEHFDLVNSGSYTKLIIRDPWENCTGTEMMYYLGTNSKQKKGTDAEFIQVPVKRVVCMSATYLGFIASLDKLSSVVGISGAQYVCNDSVRAGLSNGTIKDVGNSENPNYEMIVSLKPDLVIVYGIGAEILGYVKKLKGLGIPVIINAEYLEQTPLGRAEWIEFFAALFGEQEKARAKFAEIEKGYEETQKQMFAVQSKPNVLTGLPFKDIWYTPGGHSYLATLIADAGGSYIWANDTAKYVMPLDVEHVFIKGYDADVWLHTGAAQSLSDIITVDKRLNNFRPYKNGMVFNNDARQGAQGGNEYWETGAVNPHIVLKDLASILHPELFVGYKPYYYRKLQ